MGWFMTNTGSQEGLFPMMSVKLLAICFVCMAMVAASGAKAANPVVTMETSMGTVKIELYEDKAPVSVKNFLSYVDDKFYDSTIFHRVMGRENNTSDFMIQGGGFTADMKEKANKKAAIKNEASNGISNARGTVAMARTGDPDSATCQFYINIGNNTFLDKAESQDGHGYCVFGKVTEGMDIVDKIKAVPTGRKGGMGNVPNDTITIKSIRKAAGS